MTDRYAVIGNPVEHSKSPLIHAEFARQTGQDMCYERILAPIGGFAESVNAFIAEGGRGLNVTVPFKEDAWMLATQRSPRAEAARAVNTLKLLPDGTLWGDTTDGVGLVQDIRANLGVALQGRHILLLGAGGAARGVITPLMDALPASLTIANRTAEKASTLAKGFSGVTGGGFEIATDINFDVVINATASSLQNELPPLPDGVFAPGALAYDMMYGRETPFMAFARTHGASMVADGLGMLIEQAAESFRLWRGIRPETSALLARFRNT